MISPTKGDFMHPATQRFIEVLRADVVKWEDAAKRVDDLLPHLHPAEVEGWKATATGYRENAAEYKSLIEQATENDRRGKLEGQ
jgi:hypothetical protein